ncbi:hypothetical protein [Rosistilla oblonga]|uniref:hypothetical protein n=1 Tax=Rosistilla oblonga TaxID=2527990 RepID=UPI003A97DC74
MLKTPDATDQRADIKSRLASQAAERQHQLKTACDAIAGGEAVDTDFVVDLCSQIGLGEDAFGSLMKLADRDVKQQELEQNLAATEAAKAVASKRWREIIDAEKAIVEKYEKWLKANRPSGEPTAAEAKAIRKKRAPILDIQDDLNEARRIADSRNRERDSLVNSLDCHKAETRKLISGIKAEHPALHWI